jgi:hypothetical protein
MSVVKQAQTPSFLHADTFFDSVRNTFGKLSQSKVSGINLILTASNDNQITSLAYIAYELATAWHETNGTMQPVREAYWLSDDWRKTHLRYYPWYGRGFVQLTWDYNYEKADREAAAAGLIKPGDIMANPDLVMRQDIAAFVMARGMTEGWFTDKKLSDYLPHDDLGVRKEFIKARYIINGQDKAELIAGYALSFQTALHLAA